MTKEGAAVWWRSPKDGKLALISRSDSSHRRAGNKTQNGSAALQTIVLPGTRQRRKRSCRRPGNKTPERLHSKRSKALPNQGSPALLMKSAFPAGATRESPGKPEAPRLLAALNHRKCGRARIRDRSQPEYELYAVATTRQETAHEAADKFGILHAHVGADSLIASPDVDLVVVNNRAPEHFPVALAAIEAGKHVYCEWPLTTNTADSRTLLDAAEKATVRHEVGLQRRMAASSGLLKRLLGEGYVGEVRSVHLHVSEPTYFQTRAKVLGFTVPGENFSSVVTIYGGHFFDMTFEAVGWPREMSAVLANQFESVRLEETGEILASTAPDQGLFSGTLDRGAVLSVHVEGGEAKRLRGSPGNHRDRG